MIRGDFFRPRNGAKRQRSEQSVDDPSDWPLRDAADLEQAMRCPVCGELMSPAVILRTCGHSFCALCVRRHMRGEAIVAPSASACPQCREGATPGDIVPNRAMQHAIAAYRRARPALLAAVRAYSAVAEHQLHSDLPKDEAMKQRIKEPVYSVMSDAEIRRFLSSHGLPTNGPRDRLIRRCTELVLVQNAAMDGISPGGIADVRQAVAANERLWDVTACDSGPLPSAIDEHFRSLIASAKRP